MVESVFKNYKNDSLIERIKKDLLARIVDRGFEPGERLPSEPELAALLGVSRNSLREAVCLLENDGYLVRKKGVGTFITDSEPIIRGGIERLRGIADFIRDQGYRPGSVLTRFESIDCDVSVTERLLLAPSEKVTILETIKTASGRPVAICTDIIPNRYLKGTVEVTAVEEPIFEYLLLHHGINIVFAECDLIPTVSDGMLADRLRLEAGSPMLLLEQVHYDDRNRRVLFSRSLFPAGKFAFKLIRRR